MNTLQWLNRATGPVLDLVCPPTCWAYSDPEEPPATGGLGQRARLEIAALASQSYCHHCGLSLGPFEKHDARDPCGRCGQREVGVVRLARVGTFSEPLVTLVHRLKLGRSWEVARILSPFVYQSLLAVSEAHHVSVDALIPIPLHWMRRVRRGFNQTQELAREVSRLTGFPIINALRRRRRTSEQARIDAPSLRAINMHGAFAWRPRINLAGKHVWLLDDVSTTGATLHAAATALRKLPAATRPASINAIVVCVTDHQFPPPPLPTFNL